LTKRNNSRPEKSVLILLLTFITVFSKGADFRMRPLHIEIVIWFEDSLYRVCPQKYQLDFFNYEFLQLSCSKKMVINFFFLNFFDAILKISYFSAIANRLWIEFNIQFFLRFIVTVKIFILDFWLGIVGFFRSFTIRKHVELFFFALLYIFLKKPNGNLIFISSIWVCLFIFF